MPQLKKDFKKIKRFERRHKNIILLTLSVIAAYYILASPFIKSIIINAGSLGYFGALIGGFFFSYGATTPIAIVTLFLLAKSLDPITIALIGASGAVLSDLIIYRFIKTNIYPELVDIEKEFEKEFHVKLQMKKINPKIWHKLAPILAGLIIASPLPDELAASLFGVVHYETKKFLIYSYCFNSIGILAISLSAISL